MVTCKPKRNTYLSLSLIVLALIAGLAYLLNDFYRSREFPLLFYLAGTSIITVVILLLLVKMMASYKFLAAGKDRVSLWMPLKGWRKTYSLEEILAWQEEEVKANQRVFKQLILVFSDKYSFTVSNHEHHGYEDLKKYLARKVAKKRVKN
ncbi:hypothetical protein [Cyclobacterium roseum]|uniref:hypothetical protein n=1 Tax=Cyclobacterium roseum TaxID=2666137 RepID=UPI001391B4BC|nr:hypothetical protein [Cyclobacterium roseum]